MTTDPADAPDVIPGVARLKCLPTYIVLDTSYSMKAHTDLLNESLRRVHRAAYHDPQISDFAHMSIIVFNSEPHLALPMSDIRQVTKLPRVACSGSTEYAKVFDLLRDRINADVPALRNANRLILRPTVFLMTDGAPTDGMRAGDLPPVADDRIWKASLSRLVDPAWERRPHVITFGFGDANEQVLGTVATLQAFIASEQANQAEALREVFAFLIRTLSISANSGNLNVPTEMDGFRTVPLEDIR
ncbi:MAG TPA: hypothetical protein VGS97_15740 [Actinocrinis sp.]|uniref:vWA domain-containing protein n=1 Tax=Actinocrinis sp. TaxID=1920516 RepID=UPI002DDD86C0|nr:hypothetical protein [Actinocrinis sp.]HEV2345550.1 hypothetical protein [Actinocrinis sp.]